MKIHSPQPITDGGTIRRYGELADQGAGAEAAAQAWTHAGFASEETARWLDARCFDPQAARALAELDVTPEQAKVRTRDGGGDYVDTIAHKVARGDLTVLQGAARTLSSR